MHPQLKFAIEQLVEAFAKAPMGDPECADASLRLVQAYETYYPQEFQEAFARGLDIARGLNDQS